MNEPEYSLHHLFTYGEIRAKLVEFWGQPRTDAEHKKLQRDAMRVWNMIPRYRIPHDLHRQIHEKEE